MVNIGKIIENQRRYFSKGETKNLDFRMEKLNLLRAAIIHNENKIAEALKKDLNKSPFESYETETGLVLGELKYVLKHLPKWTRYKKVKTPITNFLSTSYTYSEPYGVILIMSPWNYPFQLAIMPLVGSIAAGNCSILKPSAYSPNTSEIVNNLIRENFDESYISVVTGGRETNQSLLKQKFDYVFFTGSFQVGKIVMEAASKHLTPVTLELGGKSPCIVDKTADIDLTAKRIVWGKTINAGQTCIAPDYIMVHDNVKEKLIDKMKYYITQFYGNEPCNNSEYPKVINKNHYKRLLRLMDGQDVIFGGQANETTNQISPTLLKNVSLDDDVMKEEIFGPILPILTFQDLNEVVDIVNSRPKPLALYLFSNDKIVYKRIIKEISFGGGCINDTVVHFASSHMPFGGIGESGMGKYHGKASFVTFSHEKSIVKKSSLIDIPLRYPPYKDNLKLLKKIMK